MIIDNLILLRLKIEGTFRNVRITGTCYFNRKRLFNGLDGISAEKNYPITIDNSKLCGNITLNRRMIKILGSSLETDVTGSVSIGNFCTIVNSHILAGNNKVSLGNYCSIAPNCMFLTYGHYTDRLTSYYINSNLFGADRCVDIKNYGDIIIEDDVWIGANCIILGGVKIGRGSIIGAGSIVTKDVPRYHKFIGQGSSGIYRQRFDSILINELEKIKWWTLEPSELKKYAPMFTSPITLDIIQEIKERNLI